MNVHHVKFCVFIQGSHHDGFPIQSDGIRGRFEDSGVGAMKEAARLLAQSLLTDSREIDISSKRWTSVEAEGRRGSLSLSVATEAMIWSSAACAMID